MNCTRLELSLVLTLFGNSEIGGRVYSDPGNLISLRQLLIGTSHITDFFFRKGFFSFIRVQHVLSEHLISLPRIGVILNEMVILPAV